MVLNVFSRLLSISRRAEKLVSGWAVIAVVVAAVAVHSCCDIIPKQHADRLERAQAAAAAARKQERSQHKPTTTLQGCFSPSLGSPTHREGELTYLVASDGSK